jgi:hypothetical protein
VTVFEFDRYINGALMAEGVTIERASTLDDAAQKAAAIAAKGRFRETPVLVLRAAAKVRANSEGDGEVKAAVQKAYDAINAGGAPYSARECRASYAISTALAILDASIPATGGEKPVASLAITEPERGGQQQPLVWVLEERADNGQTLYSPPLWSAEEAERYQQGNPSATIIPLFASPPAQEAMTRKVTEEMLEAAYEATGRQVSFNNLRLALVAALQLGKEG